jgi:ABC-type transport system involved in multi-copper enzyme maturation permease subunit
MAFPTIAKLTIANNLRKPGLYLTVVIFAVLIFLSHYFTLFTLGETTSMVREVGVSSIFLCGVLMAVFLSASSLAGEIEAGTLEILLSRPVSRSGVILAKFTGTFLTCAAALVDLTIVFLITLAIDGSSIDMLTLQAVVLSFGACAGACAVTFLLASLMPFSATVLISLCVFALGSLSGYLVSLAGGLGAGLIRGFLVVVPDFDLLNLTNTISAGKPLPAASFAWSLVYALAYTSAALTAACMIFSRREVK